jgi:hypothetical protein
VVVILARRNMGFPITDIEGTRQAEANFDSGIGASYPNQSLSGGIPAGGATRGDLESETSVVRSYRRKGLSVNVVCVAEPDSEMEMSLFEVGDAARPWLNFDFLGVNFEGECEGDGTRSIESDEPGTWWDTDATNK